MNNLKLVESMIAANDTNGLDRFTKEYKEKFSKLNVKEQSPKIKFHKDGTALHFIPKSFLQDTSFLILWLYVILLCLKLCIYNQSISPFRILGCSSVLARRAEGAGVPLTMTL